MGNSKDGVSAAAERMLQMVLDTIPARVFWKDKDSRYLGCNRLFALDAGLSSPDEVVGKLDTELAWRDQADAFRADDRDVMETGEPKLAYEAPQTTADGGTIWLRRSKIPLRDESGTIVGVLGTYEDITEARKAAEERSRLETQIRHAQKLESLGVLAGGIAHDFNNMLVAILGHAELALDDMSQLSPGRNSVQEISRAAKRARDLTNQMLAYSGKGRVAVRTLQLNDVVLEMRHLLEAAISRRITLQLDLAEDLPPVDVDAGQMRQMVLNLVTNGAEAFGDGSGVVTIRTGLRPATAAYLAQSYVNDELPSGRYVFLEVADQGCGMDDDTRARLFDPFFSTKFTGRGLGLAVVLGIVRGHRGAINVYSEPGRGTGVKVLLPAGQADTERVEKPAWMREADEAERKTVLVVDDESYVRDIGGRMLERIGFTVLAADSGPAALKLFDARRDEIDLVLLDVTMPDMDGEETFRRLRELEPNARVILMSGYNEADATRRFVGRGLGGFLQKPFTFDDLLKKVRSVVDKD